jgi:hypothetical protein
MYLTLLIRNFFLKPTTFLFPTGKTSKEGISNVMMGALAPNMVFVRETTKSEPDMGPESQSNLTSQPIRDTSV